MASVRTPSWAATVKSKTTVWRWQERFVEAAIAGLLRDRTRPPSKAPISAGKTAEVVRLAECRRRLLRQTYPQTTEARCLLLRRRAAGRHQPIHRRAQRDRGKALYLARRSGRDHSCPKPRLPSTWGARLSIEPRDLGGPRGCGQRQLRAHSRLSIAVANGMRTTLRYFRS